MQINIHVFIDIFYKNKSSEIGAFILNMKDAQKMS